MLSFLIFRYDTFLPIHHMWCTYMAELLGLPTLPPEMLNGEVAQELQHKMPSAAMMQPKIVKAEFHGAIIEGAKGELGLKNSLLISSMFMLRSQSCKVETSHSLDVEAL